MKNKRCLPILFSMLLIALASCGHEHVWDAGTVTKQPTEYEEGIKEFKCDGCEEVSYQTIEKTPHEHTYSSEWSYDTTSHWHNANCGHNLEITDKADHNWNAGTVTKQPTYKDNGVKTYTCTVCGATKREEIEVVAHEHSYEVPGGEPYYSDETNHWKICTYCDLPMEVQTHTGGTATCSEKAVCDVCNESYGEIAPHDIEGNYAHNETGHWNVCSNEGCDKTTVLIGHVYDKKVTNKSYFAEEATCEVANKYYYSCICGVKGTETFESGEPLGHTGGTATCTTLATCSRCLQPYGDYAEHKYSELTEKVAPTCEENGMEAYYRCSACYGYFTEHKTPVKEEQLVIPSMGHFMVEFKDGTHTWEECAREDCEHKTEVVGHVFDQKVATEDYFSSAATCEEASKYYYSCLCGKKGTETFDHGVALGHTGGTATCEVLAKCSRCLQPYGEYAQHEFTELAERVAPTCEEDGMEAHYRCTICFGYFTELKTKTTKEYLVIEKLGHYLVEKQDETHTWQECNRENCDYQITNKEESSEEEPSQE